MAVRPAALPDRAAAGPRLHQSPARPEFRKAIRAGDGRRLRSRRRLQQAHRTRLLLLWRPVDPRSRPRSDRTVAAAAPRSDDAGAGIVWTAAAHPNLGIDRIIGAELSPQLANSRAANHRAATVDRSGAPAAGPAIRRPSRGGACEARPAREPHDLAVGRRAGSRQRPRPRARRASTDSEHDAAGRRRAAGCKGRRPGRQAARPQARRRALPRLPRRYPGADGGGGHAGSSVASGRHRSGHSRGDRERPSGGGHRPSADLPSTSRSRAPASCCRSRSRRRTSAAALSAHARTGAGRSHVGRRHPLWARDRAGVGS